MATRSAEIRLGREVQRIKEHPSLGIEAAPVEDNLFRWMATIKGPEDTPYEGGIFHLKIAIPNNYPFNPPKIRFVTRVYHPNINGEGGICIDILRDQWSAAMTIDKVLLSISALLGDPNPADPLEPEIARVFKHNRQLFNQTVKEWVRQYAQP